MASFSETDLASYGETGRSGAPQVRLAMSHIPGVNGAYLSTYGHGARQFEGNGFLEAQGGSKASALSSLVTAFEAVASLAAGASLAAYQHTDGSSHSNCLLASYDRVGPVEYEEDGGTVRARMRVRWIAIEPAPVY